MGSGDEHEASQETRLGDELLGGTIDDPVLLAGVGIVAGNAVAAGEDQLLLAGRVNEERGAIGAGPVGPVGPPALGSSPDAEIAVVRFPQAGPQPVQIILDPIEAWLIDPRT